MKFYEPARVKMWINYDKKGSGLVKEKMFAL